MDRITFTVNGVRCYVGREITSDVTLLDYLRNYLELRGTKYMCREGGCGACVVAARRSPSEKIMSVNACLVSVTSCMNWEITTIEKVGNRLDGYHLIQSTFVENHATQCGHCSPGWIMALYSLLQNKPNVTMLEIEKSFGGHVCRCTGYRPILQSLKKFGQDAPRRLKITDIEDVHKCKKNCTNCNKSCKQLKDEWDMVEMQEFLPNILEIDLRDGKYWYRVTTLRDIFEVLDTKGTDSYMLVAGNTARGVIPVEEMPNVMIDITGIPELKGWQQDQNLIVGAGSSITELIEIFENMSAQPDFSYLKTFVDHLQLIGHVSLRNIGTIAGNLMVKHASNSSPSDLFLIFAAVNGQLTIMNRSGSRKVSLEQFLLEDMTGQVIVDVSLPPLNSSEYKIQTYKVMKRAQNVRAIINGAFVYKLTPDNIVSECKIIYSGLKAPYSIASSTQLYLTGKNLFTNETLQAALQILDSELEAVEYPPEPPAEYRKKLAKSLFYKSCLSFCPVETINVRYRSAVTKLRESRGLSSGTQHYETESDIWPLTEPVPKAEALIQVSGEAPYTEDMPKLPNEVFGSFVLTTEPTGTIASCDASAALAEPGVIAFYTAKDIPGLNSFTPNDMPFYTDNEEVLCSGTVKYFNQPMGIIVAESRYIADKAAKLVKVTYRNVRTPVIDIKEAIKDSARVTDFYTVPATESGSDIVKTFTGSKTVYQQYHYCMETLVCVTKPVEDGFEVHDSAQWIDCVQMMVHRALNIKANSVDVHVRRLGGGLGLKLTRSIQIAVASALVASKLNRPCRFIQSMGTNMKAVGKRFPATNEYTVSVNSEGVIQQADYTLYEDNGYKLNEQIYLLTVHSFTNVYSNTRWNLYGKNVITDTAKNTWCRSPGALESVAMAEFLMERIAYELSLDPIDVRLANLNKESYGDIIEMLETLKENSDWAARRTAVERFNTENRWKKRGLRSTCMQFMPPTGQNLVIVLSVNHCDGTVSITHSGIEMGQGLNTKALQIAAHFLKISMDKIKIKSNNTIIGPNASLSGGSFTNQNVGLGVQRACEIIMGRLEPIRAENPNDSWEDLITKAYAASINLQAQGFVAVTDNDYMGYVAFGVCFAEVEVDILTGEHEVLRIDLIQDVGRAINPEIDIGQVEGAFAMGLGYWTCENMEYVKETGELLTNRAWTYHVPQARDIPQDFRIYFRKDSRSPDIILGNKAIGEPPLCLAQVVPLAIRECMVSARLEAGLSPTEWFDVDGPYTLAAIFSMSNVRTEDFRFY